VNGQHRDLPPRKEPIGTSEQKAGWALEQVWKSQGEKNILYLPGFEP